LSRYSTPKLLPLQSVLIDINKNIEEINPYCINENKACLYKETTQVNVIDEPFPEVMTLNLNWFHQEISYVDLLKFYITIN